MLDGMLRRIMKKVPHHNFCEIYCPELCPISDVFSTYLREDFNMPCQLDETIDEALIVWQMNFKLPHPISKQEAQNTRAIIQNLIDNRKTLKDPTKAQGNNYWKLGDEYLKLEGILHSPHIIKFIFSTVCPFFKIRQLAKQYTSDIFDYFGRKKPKDAPDEMEIAPGIMGDFSKDNAWVMIGIFRETSSWDDNKLWNKIVEYHPELKNSPNGEKKNIIKAHRDIEREILKLTKPGEHNEVQYRFEQAVKQLLSNWEQI